MKSHFHNFIYLETAIINTLVYIIPYTLLLFVNSLKYLLISKKVPGIILDMGSIARNYTVKVLISYSHEIGEDRQ